MSFYDDASLVVIPSAQKTSKLYAVKPTDGSGDLAFTRTGDTATRVNSAGIIEKVRTNLVLQSNTFSTTWANDDSTETSGQTGYDGTTNAWLLAKTAANGRIGQVLTVSGSVTFSIYAKAGTDSWVRLASSDAGVNAYFNLGTGAVGSTGANTTAAITSVGNGWYRCSISGNASFTFFNIWVADADNDTSGTSGNILIQAAQIETGDVATAYIPTTTAAVSVGPVANVPRLDYLGSTCGKLLLEPQRTNLVTYSEQLNNAVWVKDFSGTGTAPVVTANYTTSPDGYQNADRVQFSAVGKTLTSDYSLIGQYPITLGATGTFSFYLKSLTSGNQNVLVYWGAGQGQVYVVTPQWQRFTLENCASGFAGIAFGTRGGTGFTAGGDQTLDIAIWGAQLEAGAYATSYIPTLAASATRGAEKVAKTGISSLIGQTEGTIYFEINKTARTDSEYRFNLSDGTSNNWIFLGIEASNVPRFYVRAAASTGVDFSGSALSSGTHKVAAAYKQNDFVLYVDGVQVGSDTSGNVGATSQLHFGGNYIDQVAETDSRTAQALLFKTRLTNAQLAELTTL